MIKFSAILTTEAALKAVESDGDALQYVLDLNLFLAFAAKFNFETDQK